MPGTRLQRGLRTTFTGLAVNGLLAIAKLAAGIGGHSHALVADAVESFADLFSSLIVWRSLVVADKPADEDHPYGHGKAEPIASAVIATMLLFAAVGIGLRSVQEISAPHQGPEPWTLLVLVVVVLIKELLFRFSIREGRALDSLAVKSDAWHHRSDAITSLAAAIGITVSLIGGKGYEGADDVAAILAAGIIAWNGWRLLRPALEELMDATPNPAIRDQITTVAAAIPGVDAVQKCLVRRMGDRLFVDMHVHVDRLMTVERSHAIAHAVKDAIREELPIVYDVLIHIEPSRVPESGTSASAGIPS